MNSLEGHLLIASADLLDPNFAHGVILMVDHGEGGAMGILLNRPTEATLADLPVEVLGTEVVSDKPLHLGGPVPGPLMVLHSEPGLADRELIPGVYLSLDATKVRELIDRRAEPLRIIVNYSGWTAGQLEEELEQDSWLILPASAKHVFGTADSDLWASVVGRLQARKLSEFLGVRVVPIDPSMN